MHKSNQSHKQHILSRTNQPHYTPVVSIIIPIYNVAPYLAQCIQSVLAQSYENLDIILVDDGSSDESLAIALEFAKKDKRIFVVSKPNGGQATARNYGLEFIKGSALREFFESGLKDKQSSHIQSFAKTHSFSKTYKSLSTQEVQNHFQKIQPNFITSDLERINDFITQELPQNALIHFIDSDDFIESNCIELCVQNLCEKDLDIFVHNWSDFSEETQTLSKGAYMKLKKNSYESGLELLSHNKIYNFYFAWQGLFKADILNRYALRYTEGIYHEDHDFGTLLFALAKRSAYSDEALYVYRKRAGSITNHQNQVGMPPKLPSFLEPLREDFSDYKSLRAYFKAYCFVVVGLRLWEFYEAINALDKSLENSSADFAHSRQLRQRTDNASLTKRGVCDEYRGFFGNITLGYVTKVFKISLKKDPMGLKTMLKQIHFPKHLVWWHFVKDLHRQPKKLLHIANMRYFGR